VFAGRCCDGLVLVVAVFVVMLRSSAFGMFADGGSLFGVCVFVCGVRFGVGALLGRQLFDFAGLIFNLNVFVGDFDFDVASGVQLFRAFVRTFGFFFLVVFVEFGATDKSIGFGLVVGFFLLGFNETGGKRSDFFFA
jgi:hypothetical protein